MAARGGPPEFWFKPGTSGNPEGRKPNRAKAVLDQLFGKRTRNLLTDFECRYFMKSLLTMNSDNLQSVAKSATVPSIMRAYAMAEIVDMKQGKTTTVDKMCDRIWGKPTNRIEGEITHRNEPTEDELLEELNRLRESIDDTVIKDATGNDSDTVNAD